MYDISAAVLAGGASRRFGSNKALAAWRGKTLIEAVIDAASEIFDDIFIVSNNPEAFSFTGLDVVPDIHPGCGPLAGLEAAMEHSGRGRLMLLACDMPLVPPALLRHIAELALEKDALIAAPLINGYPQPLCAVYKRELLSRVRLMIDRNDLRIRALFEGIEYHGVSETEMKDMISIEPETALRSANTMEILRELETVSLKVRA